MNNDYISILNTLEKTIKDLWHNHHFSNVGMQKGAADIVTETDLKFEEALIKILRQISPSTPILSEETLSNTLSKGTYFTIDPVDGTWNFANGIGIYGTQVALVEDDEPTLGIIYLPTFDQCFVASKGNGTYLNNQRVYVEDKENNKAIIGLADFRKQDSELLIKLAGKMVNTFGKTRITGASCFGYSMVSCGAYQGRISVKPHLWDIAPGICLVNEAQGVSTFNENYSIVAASPKILELMEDNYKSIFEK